MNMTLLQIAYHTAPITELQRGGLLLLAIILIYLFISLFKTEPTSKCKLIYEPWEGPKTDARINKMLAECIELLKELEVPISDSICPEVALKGYRGAYGKCRKKVYKKKPNEYDFYIEISGHTLGNTERSLRNTLIHELLHTIDFECGHRGAWKRWAKYVSEKTGYNIQRVDGGETDEDYARLRGTYVEVNETIEQ